ncbi:hypothetical protein [Longispora fulva]|uniref:Uncharacterized protein n=1 Tax=Longispora fulva TaxID=619741 RepID=A0A8J7GRC7_9ACTN|nr:hypothetical protein [Longispora fulva]MBG6137339.1 hypothetical protein [Longispora fulva]
MTAPVRHDRARFLVAGGWLVLYLSACATPALEFAYRDGGPAHSDLGVNVLIGGAFGLFVGQFGWYANLIVPFALALLLARQYLAAAICAAVAVLIALDTLLLFGHPIPLDEGGSPDYVLHRLGIGFFLWIASMLAILVPSIGWQVTVGRAGRRAPTL